MSRFRWSIKELQEKTSPEILMDLCNERLSDLNSYSPLARKIRDCREWLQQYQPTGRV